MAPGETSPLLNIPVGWFEQNGLVFAQDFRPESDDQLEHLLVADWQVRYDLFVSALADWPATVQWKAADWLLVVQWAELSVLVVYAALGIFEGLLSVVH